MATRFTVSFACELSNICSGGGLRGHPVCPRHAMSTPLFPYYIGGLCVGYQVLGIYVTAHTYIVDECCKRNCYGFHCASTGCTGPYRRTSLAITPGKVLKGGRQEIWIQGPFSAA